MRRRHAVVLIPFLVAAMLAAAVPVAATPRVAVLEVKGMVCSA